jgi:hypothetical protein
VGKRKSSNFIQILDKTKIHFFPKDYWLKLGDKKIKYTDFCPLEALSGMSNGMTTAGYPYTKSPYYTAPYLLIFLTQQHGIEPYSVASPSRAGKISLKKPTFLKL